MVGAAPEPDAKPPSAGEVGALRTKLATLSAINGALRDENDELRRAVEEASDAGGKAGSDVARRLADAEETVASLTRQRDELEAHLLDRSEDDSEANSRLADAKRRNRDREKELERAAREIGVLQGERRKLELATADARRERGAAEQKLARAEENARFARERHEAEARDAEALLEDLRRRLTRSERDAKAERASLLTQLEAAQSATAAALGEEAQTAVADAEARAAKAERDAEAARAAAAAAEAAAAEAAEAAANEIRGAESRARDAESGGASFDEALASAVAETARAAERNRRELARARTELANESRSRARLEKELEEDRKQSSAKIEELTRESRQGSMERQAALSAVRDRASAAEADATRAEARVVELTDAAAELARALDAEREENAERDRSAAALASGVDALRAELEETRARLERLTDERDRAREEAAEARVEANERNAALGTTNRNHPDRDRDVRYRTNGSADRPPVVSPSRVDDIDDKARDTIRDTIHAFGGGGFDVSALVESGRNERARRTEKDATIRAAVRDVEANHKKESAKRDAELADTRERAESAESALAVLLAASDASDASDASESSPSRRRRAAMDAASANLERYREEARAANESRAALAADHETLLEMLGEKTETCDVLETSLRLATERLERHRDATDAARFDVSQPGPGFNSGGSARKTTRPSRRDAYVATLTHAVFVARGGSELEPTDD